MEADQERVLDVAKENVALAHHVLGFVLVREKGAGVRWMRQSHAGGTYLLHNGVLRKHFNGIELVIALVSAKNDLKHVDETSYRHIKLKQVLHPSRPHAYPLPCQSCPCQ